MNGALALRPLRTLELAAAPGFVAAASGLVATAQQLVVVADDELALAVFERSGAVPGVLHPLLGGDLPPRHAERKAAKPDFEALLALPADRRRPHGALMALGSGSRPNRSRGAWLALDAHGRAAGAPQAVDLAPLHAVLRAALGAPLNLEGALFADGELLLLQRANAGWPQNAVAAFDAAAFCAWLDGGALPVLRRLQPLDLGTLGGVPFGFTDGAAVPGGGWVFSAAAEDTADAYADGRSAGSVLGRVDAAGRLVHRQTVTPACKIEGIAIAALVPGAIELLAVTDADDRALPALLYAATLPR